MANIKIIHSEILSKTKYELKKITFELQKEDGSWLRQEREVYERRNAAAILLYNKAKQTIILTEQFRLPTYLNGNESGMLVEACAGLLEKDEHPADAIVREVQEETGYVIPKAEKVLEAYSSAGGLTELIYCYIAGYTDELKKGPGGGLEEEGENVKVKEMKFSDALEWVFSGQIRDAKTIMLIQYLRLKEIM